MTQVGSLESEAELELEDEYEAEWEDELEGEEELEGEYEAEDELEGEFEDEFEDELRSEFEAEWEGELEDEAEGEWEDEDEGEEFIGGLVNLAGSLLGQSEYEAEWEGEAEGEEELFIGRAVGFFKKHRKLFKRIAKVAAPLVATAVGGPAAGALARAVTSQLEGEMEAELEAELEEMASAPVTASQAMGEYLAASAASAESEAEAEAFIGSAVTIALSRRDRRELEELLPHLLRGATVLTRVLRRSGHGRQGIRLVPGIMDSAARTIVRHQGTGRAVRPADLGAIIGRSARRVLSDPRYQSALARRHARGVYRVRRHRGYRGYPTGRGGHGGRGGHRGYGRSGRPVTVRRRAVHTRTVGRRGQVGRPRPGFVRVVTPVRVPARDGRPARTVRVVSDVKVPRGAVPSGRPASVGGRRR
jgi:hypothetical protein